MKVKVIVTPKETVLDPQGAAVREAMQHLGFSAARDVRIGRYLEIELEGDPQCRNRNCANFAAICSPTR